LSTKLQLIYHAVSEASKRGSSLNQQYTDKKPGCCYDETAERFDQKYIQDTYNLLSTAEETTPLRQTD